LPGPRRVRALPVAPSRAAGPSRPSQFSFSCAFFNLSIRPASSRVQSLTVAGKAVRLASPSTVAFDGRAKTVPIVVTAHDGKTTETYRLTLTE